MRELPSINNKIGRYIKNKKWIIPYFLKKDTAFFPSIIYLVVNSSCNLHCKMCDVGQQQKGTQFYQNMVASREEIPLGQLKKLIDEVKHFKPIIAITSTEPLLYHDLMDFVRYVVGSGLEIQITTNGYLLQEFAEEIVNLGVNVISVSIDGPSEVHNEIRGRNDSYERAIKGIQRITEHKKKTGKNFPEIRMNYSISNFNYKSLTDFFKGIKELEIESISVSHLNFVTNEMAREHNKEFGSGFPATPSSISSVNLAGIDIDDLYNQIREIKATCQRCTFTPELTRDQLKIFYREPEVFLKKHTCCRIPWNAAQIFANGDVGVSTRCFHIKFGNIYDEKFSNIWNGEKMRNFRNQLLRSGAFPACSRCCGVF